MKIRDGTNYAKQQTHLVDNDLCNIEALWDTNHPNGNICIKADQPAE